MEDADIAAGVAAEEYGEAAGFHHQGFERGDMEGALLAELVDEPHWLFEEDCTTPAKRARGLKKAVKSFRDEMDLGDAKAREALAEALRVSLADDPVRRRELGAFARSYAEHSFAKEPILARWLSAALRPRMPATVLPEQEANG